MTTQFIITLNTADQPLVRVRDGLLLCACWIMWAAVFTAFVNGCEWEALGMSVQRWLLAQEAFLRAVLASLHIPSAYVVMMMLLVLAFFLWSLLNQALAPAFRKQRMTPPLTLEDIARHFQLDLALVGSMQKEKQIMVFHAMSGAVTELRSIQCDLRQPVLEA
ncbi:poly-beta-1,6-N-acetyl-D-glucosamine biosynthesis protein PgaD [Herbaspirillum sp. WKF16]|jgi:poly-beta-1,6-N-acetyl-D-glucosamine biosynthesis protein PgaD|uniref:poly-beta-1,6-N-acetyl-D-glucosamine biosynthesis protein PgaD n=1 Tax=Herbaspirillum sp. WKF16 TaxID=3028312 RepID=UPI0023AA023A|nr:poly-beta-1,6-N-acetyl-D-glucosamine biosynthesis protein PgaD [Herbaspirillum sp. WKF16]WDZ95220.1 poly-beta-1,6-N-acetyl-D-glucosamine biosynthesis protein PgaD [Herbaspirillum sp. WKF16]